MLLGLISQGHTIHVCQGTFSERNAAFEAIERNRRKGCVLDAITLHVVRRLKLESTVTDICGPIGVVDRTLLRYEQRIFELEERIDEPSMSLGWRDGQAFREVVTQDQKREALQHLRADLQWLRQNAVVVEARGNADPSPSVRRVMREFGSDIMDEVLAAQGGGLLLVSEDKAVRSSAQADFGIHSTWLQPVLMRALEEAKITRDEYVRVLATLVDSHCEFITIDSAVLLHTLSGYHDVSLPQNFKKFADRLGGRKAELASHLRVAFAVILDTWKDKGLPLVLRQAVTGRLIESVCRERPVEHIGVIFSALADFEREMLEDASFANYLEMWLQGHFIVLEPRGRRRARPTRRSGRSDVS
jgi:hypothetical protein